ncbi:MAG: hypothetical protein HW421_2378 [Ignavibacteria bacterium]|nr:hypothetical protein [Ignavibacteria bacterium]
MQYPELSVCIIVLNEEKMLGDCLESVKPYSSEIILVDTGSDDRTLEIAEKYGCRIIKSHWNDDFAEARNLALAAAQYPYILSIDADERLLNGELLKEIILQSPAGTGGWLIEVVSEARRNDGGLDTFTTNLLRLFVNHKDVRFSGIIHEQILESVLKAGFTIHNTPLKFVHLGYTHSPDEMRIKQSRNLILLDKALAADTNNAHNLYQRGKTHLALGDLEKAERDMSRSIDMAAPGSAILPQALNYGGIVAFQRKDFEVALQRAERSLSIVENQQFGNYIKAEALMAMGNFRDGLAAFEKMSEARNADDVMTKIIGDYYLPMEQYHYRCGCCYVGMKQYYRAKQEFQKGNKLNPSDSSNIVGLANVAYQFENFDEAKRLLNDALKLSPGSKEILTFIKQVENAMLSQQTDMMMNTKLSQSSERPLLSLCMIVKNEEKQLPDCLESVRGVADEIIIVDTGSTDSTKQIAQRYGAKIFNFPWIDDFAAARNESIRHATGEWLLYLDADERLSIQSREKLRNLLLNAGKDIGGYICTIESPHLQLDGSSEMHRGGYPRIFRNYGYPNIIFKGRVHEQITPSIFALGKLIDLSDIVISHLGYNVNRETMESKIKRNYSMLIRHVQEEPLNGYAWFQLGQTLAQMFLFKEAESAIRFAIENGELSDSVYASASSTLAQFVGNQRKFDEALFWAERSLEKAPNQVFALNIKAYSLLYLDRAAEAELLFLEVRRRLQQNRGVPRSGFDIDIPEKVIEQGLAEARKKIGKNY